MNQYDIVDEFEKRVAEYAGAKYGVAVNSCTSGIMLSALYRKITNPNEIQTNKVSLPKHTYVGVPYALINAGYKIDFVDLDWKGNYDIEPINVIDSARRFRKDMYVKDSLYCLSFHETKHLSIGDGGMILTDDKQAYDALRQMRFDGRTPGLSVFDDQFVFPAHHCHMKPDVATRGVMLMAAMKDFNEDLPEKYPDLSQHKIFKEGY
jgi:dTDP-4-amino-4,6-dideoxygalactose transaminase